MSGSTIGEGWNLPNFKGEPDPTPAFKSAKTRQAEALERIADTLDRMLAVMLDEPEDAVDLGATLADDEHDRPNYHSNPFPPIL